MKRFSDFLFVVIILLSGSAASLQAQERCDDECVKVVKSLLKETTNGISSSFGEKNNARLGDKVSVGLLKIFKGKTIFKPANVRVFLPVIRAAFEHPELISQPEDKKPTVTIKLLKRTRKMVKDRYLKTQITQTINTVLFSTNSLESNPPPNNSLDVSAKQRFC